MQPGDLVFYAYNPADPSTIHHVGIYIGAGNMIDAPYTGANVRITPFLRGDFIGAVRPTAAGQIMAARARGRNSTEM
jgi:peptidoglycan DL-endopeptidase RipA